MINDNIKRSSFILVWFIIDRAKVYKIKQELKFYIIFKKKFAESKFCVTFALAKPIRLRKRVGAIAQLVEQRTENPCVPGSIPGGTT